MGTFVRVQEKKGAEVKFATILDADIPENVFSAMKVGLAEIKEVDIRDNGVRIYGEVNPTSVTRFLRNNGYE